MVHWVYFIQQIDSVGLIKIGYSKDIDFRMEDFKTGNPYELRLLGAIKLAGEYQAREVERQVHKVFDYCRRKGEWFSPSLPLREFIAYTALHGDITEAMDLAWEASKKLRRKKHRRDKYRI